MFDMVSYVSGGMVYFSTDERSAKSGRAPGGLVSVICDIGGVRQPDILKE